MPFRQMDEIKKPTSTIIPRLCDCGTGDLWNRYSGIFVVIISFH